MTQRSSRNRRDSANAPVPRADAGVSGEQAEFTFRAVLAGLAIGVREHSHSERLAYERLVTCLAVSDSSPASSRLAGLTLRHKYVLWQVEPCHSRPWLAPWLHGMGGLRLAHSPC